MLVSLNWLRDYVDLPRDIDAEDFARRLTMASAEVDAVHIVGAQWDRELMTVGHVLQVEPHPDADRLRLATVDFGGAEPQRVVCGAPNLAEGQRIAFGREGATVFDPEHKPMRLKRAKIRGVESSGMVLSERELGLSEEHEGILVLPENAPVGTPLVEYLGDVVLDVHVWPNRADTMNMVGMAREVAAILGLGETREPDETYESAGADVSESVAVEIEDPDLCARYIATVIEGIEIGPSPAWMQERLRAAGMRPISNVVDVTNYVMLELGQPLHSFDLDRVQGTIRVRTAREGEMLRTLDGVDRTLTSDTLLITDDRGPIALAGVMGGEETEVTDRTVNILLESARFDPVSIRRTSTRLALRSEASSRFERGLSPELALHAVRRATKLLAELCNGTPRPGMVDVYPAPHVPAEVTVTRQRLDTVIGVSVPTEEVEASLTTLGFDILESDGPSTGSAGGGAFRVRAPWWRTDVSIHDDIVEEVVRLAGYDRLPATPLHGAIPEWEPQPILELRGRITDALVDAGLQEVLTYSLTTNEVLARVMDPADLEQQRPLRLRNTLSSDREVLRPTLRHALIETVERNLRAGAEQVAVFETARVYRRRERPSTGSGRTDLEWVLDEREMVTGAIAGVELDRWGRPGERGLDFFDAKGMLEAALEAVGAKATWAATDEEFGLLPGRVAQILVGGGAVGILGEVHPETLAQFDVDERVLVFEIDLALLLEALPARAAARSVPRFPAVEQDLAVVVDEATEAGAVQAVIEGSPLVASAHVFDVFRGGQLAEGKKSLAFSIRYQAPNRTLTSEDANGEQAKILKRLEREFGAVLRG